MTKACTRHFWTLVTRRQLFDWGSLERPHKGTDTRRRKQRTCFRQVWDRGHAQFARQRLQNQICWICLRDLPWHLRRLNIHLHVHNTYVYRGTESCTDATRDSQGNFFKLGKRLDQQRPTATGSIIPNKNIGLPANDIGTAAAQPSGRTFTDTSNSNMTWQHTAPWATLA